MSIRVFSFALLILAFTSGACTVRYSQSLAGTIPDEPGSQVRSSDAGFSFFQITFSEPIHAHEQVTSLMGACKKLTKVEVDYRELSFILFGLPRVTVSGTCVR